MSFTFEGEEELNRSIQRLTDRSSKTAQEVLTSQMRLFAVDLAYNTTPIGNGSLSQKKGMDRVSRKILEIYIPVPVVAARLGDVSVRAKAHFLKCINESNFLEADRILIQHLPNEHKVGMFDGGEFHKDQRDKRRVSKFFVCVNFSKVDAYIKKKQKLVGFAKGGFARAARDIGGVRGIPGFATRQKSPGSASVIKNGNNLSVVMTNDVRYIDKALSKNSEAIAIESRKRSIELLLIRIMNNAKP